MPSPARDPHRIALLAARAASDKHAERIIILDLRALSSVTEYFIVCTALSVPQITAVQEQLERTLEQAGYPLRHAEGSTSSARQGRAAAAQEPLWVLLDFGDVVVHVMDEPTRAFYQLERLWGDAPRIDAVSAMQAPGLGPLPAPGG